MKFFNFSDSDSTIKKYRSIIFDMDSTLYTHEEYARLQVDLLIERLAKEKGKTVNQMKSEIDEYRIKWAENHSGKKISLGNVFLAFGISMEENIRWREEVCRPEDYLKRDDKLRSVLETLSSRFKFAIVTNNPVSVAVRTLSVLGVDDILKNIIGLDTFGISKPDKIHFLTAAELCKTQTGECIAVGDRYDIDIALPLKLGMSGILVDGVEDIYKLPDHL